MADNTTLNAGVGGDVIATDDIGGVKYQRVKLVWGADGVVNEVADTGTKRVPMNLAESALLPAALGANGGLKVEDVSSGFLTLQASQVSGVTNTTTTRTTTTGLGAFSQAAILLNITAPGAATGTLQIFLEDSMDNGLTWNDLASFNPFTFGASVTNQLATINGRIAGSQAQCSVQAIETMAAGNVRSGPWGDRIRVREKVSGVSGSPTGPTYTITGVFKR